LKSGGKKGFSLLQFSWGFVEICVIFQYANTKRDSLQTLTCPSVKLLLTFAAAQPAKSWHQTVHCSERETTSHSHQQQKPGSMLAESTSSETAPAGASGTTSTSLLSRVEIQNIAPHQREEGSEPVIRHHFL